MLVIEAAQLMAAKRSDCVLVVDEDEHLSGIFTVSGNTYFSVTVHLTFSSDNSIYRRKILLTVLWPTPWIPGTRTFKSSNASPPPTHSGYQIL